MEAIPHLLPFLFVLTVVFVAIVIIAAGSEHFHSAFAVLCVACFIGMHITGVPSAAGALVITIGVGLFCGFLLKIKLFV